MSELCPSGRSEGYEACADEGSGVGQKFRATLQSNFFATKNPQKPRFSGILGAARQIRTANLILTKRPCNFFLTIFRDL